MSVKLNITSSPVSLSSFVHNASVCFHQTCSSTFPMFSALIPASYICIPHFATSLLNLILMFLEPSVLKGKESERTPQQILSLAKHHLAKGSGPWGVTTGGKGYPTASLMELENSPWENHSRWREITCNSNF